jgi:hypothetical protein
MAFSATQISYGAGYQTIRPAIAPNRQRIGFGQRRLFCKRGRKRHLRAVTGHEHERNFQRFQPLGDRKAFFADQPDIEQRKIRSAIGDHFERLGHACRGPHALHAETENRFLEVERDDRVILDNQDIVGQDGHAVERDRFHDLVSQAVNLDRSRAELGTNLAAREHKKRIGRFPA